MNESKPLFFSRHLRVHESGNVGEARLARKDSALIAAVLFRDYERQRDDSTLLVAKAAVQRTGPR